jgi:branched-chain amino acid transport system substrate-binding protein
MTMLDLALLIVGAITGVGLLRSLGTRRKVRRTLLPVIVAVFSLGFALTGLSAASASVPTRAHLVTTKATKVPGVTSSQITIGATVPITGPASLGYNQIAAAAEAVFHWVNTHGGVNGRTINYLLKNDCYNLGGSGCQTTYAATSQLLDIRGGLFATVGSLGTPTQDSVLKLLKGHGTPQLFVNSGSIDWNQGTANTGIPYANRGKYPELFGWQPSYVVESKILGVYIAATFSKQKVCFLGQNDDFGTDGLLGLEDAGIHPAIQEVGATGYNPSDLSESGYMTPFIQKLASAGCQVNYLDTIPAATALALQSAESAAYWTPRWVVSSVGSDPWTIAQYLGANDDESCTNVGETPTQPCTPVISFTALPATTATNAAWNSREHTILMQMPFFRDSTAAAGHYYVKPSSVLNNDELYGIGWGIAFVEALGAAGRNFTQAQFVRVLETHLFSSNALLKLEYKAGTYATGNHQGLLGGYVDQVLNKLETQPVKGPFGGKVYVSTNAARSDVYLSPPAELDTAGPPRWL